LRQALIFGPDNGLAVDSFEPTNGEMTSRHLLKMLDKGVIDGSAANPPSVSRVGTIIKIEPVSCDFEPSLCCQITDIENWRPETGA
jgi:hypothetical protein